MSFRPQTSGERNEQMAASKAKHAMASAKDPMDRLRLFILSRGNGGIMQLGKMFRMMDDDGNKNLGFEEFKGGLAQYGYKCSPEEAKIMFERCDTDGSGMVNVDEFLIQAKPPMSKARTTLIEQVFKKLDRTGDGEITVKDIKGIYNVRSHPQYQNGECTEEELLKKFLSKFESTKGRNGKSGVVDGRVTKQEFLDYYAGVSASVDNDAYFDLMIRNAWKI